MERRAARVASLCRDSVPCEYAARLVVDAGAEVLRIRLGRRCHLRSSAPFRVFLNAGKLDVELPDIGWEHALADTLADCDAVIVDEWGRDRLDEIAIEMPVILVGERDGASLAGLDQGCWDEFLVFHGTGLGFVTPRVMPGYPSAEPLCPHAALAGMLAGLYGAIALLATLVAQHKGRKARDATVGLVGVALPLLRREISSYLYDHKLPHRNERIWQVSPAEVHRCRGGWIFVDIIEDVQWQRLCRFMGREDLAIDPRYATRDQRFAAADVLGGILDDFFADKDKSCWRAAQRQGIPIAPVNVAADLIADPQLAARQFWTTAATGYGTAEVPSSPLARLFAGQAPALRHVSGEADEAPLAGVRVLELTHVWSGPLAGQVLADLGAEVIRVESADRLDIHRRGGPWAGGIPGPNRSGTWNAQNRGKLSWTLDLKSEEGYAQLLAAVAVSDVVIENFSPGTLERLKLSLRELRAANPRIVLLRLSGFGQTGPDRDSLAYGPMMDAAIGLSAATSYDDGVPRAVNGWAADVGGALYGCAAVLRALMDESGGAVELDISQYECGVLFIAEDLVAVLNPAIADAGAPEATMTAVFETETSDEWVAVSARTPAQVDVLADLLREESAADIGAALAQWASTRPRSGVLADLAARGIPAAPVSQLPELLSDTMLTDHFLTVDHREAGPMLTYGPTIRFAGHAASKRPAPRLGEDNLYVTSLLPVKPSSGGRSMPLRSA